MNERNPESNVGTGQTTEKLRFGGFILEHARGSNDVILYNEQNVTPKLAMTIDVFQGLADKLENSAWGTRKSPASDLQRTGT